MVTRHAASVSAFGVQARNPAQRELRCWQAIGPVNSSLIDR